jgi:hypothetical protein
MRQLREEVGFACPGPKDSRPALACGNPFLEYHHFDPPWHVEEHHRPEGMVALCSEHHKKADRGSFTKEQLLGMKAEGAKKNQARTGAFDWRRRDFLVVTAGGVGVRTWVPVSYGDRPVIWFTRDASGYLALNVDMLTTSVCPRLRMWENVFYDSGTPKDFECPPSGHLVKAKYENGDSLRIEFKDLTTEGDLKRLYPNIQSVPNGLSFPAAAVEIEIHLPEARLHITRKDFRLAEIVRAAGLVSADNRRFIGIGTHEPIERCTDHVGYSRARLTPLRLASYNDPNHLPVDDHTFQRDVVSLDGYAFTNCKFEDVRLMFAGAGTFSMNRCSFPGTAIVLTDQAVMTAQALGILGREAGLDVDALLRRLVGRTGHDSSQAAGKEETRSSLTTADSFK